MVLKMHPNMCNIQICQSICTLYITFFLIIFISRSDRFTIRLGRFAQIEKFGSPAADSNKVAIVLGRFGLFSATDSIIFQQQHAKLEVLRPTCRRNSFTSSIFRELSPQKTKTKNVINQDAIFSKYLAAEPFLSFERLKKTQILLVD